MEKVNKTRLDKKTLQDKIAHMIRHGETDETILEDMPLQQLMEEVNIYHQELIFQNNELAQRGAELEESRIKYRQLFDEAPVGYVVMDQDYIIQEANSIFRAYFQMAPQDVIGKKLTSFIRPDSQDACNFMMQELKRIGKAEIAELQLASPDRQLMVHVNSNLFSQKGKQLIRCAFQDCTQQKEAENAVIAMARKAFEENQRMVYAMEGSGAATWEWNVQTDEVVLDKRWAEIVGYTLEELQPPSVATWERLTHPEDLARCKELLQQHLARKTAEYTCEIRMKHKDGRWVWVLSRGKVIEWTPDGQPLQMFGINIDITSTKNAYQELTAMHEEVVMLNDTLAIANQSLTAEVDIRQQAQQAALRREKQYQATANLLTRPGENLDGLLKSVIQNAIQLVGAPAGYIVLLDDKSENFVLRYESGTTYQMGKSQPVQLGALGQVYRSGEMIVIEDYRNYEHRIADPDFDMVKTYLAVPLVIHGKVQGALVANWYDDIHHVADEDQEIYRQFAILASLVLERAYANAHISHQNQLLQQLTEATSSLVEEQDLEKALQNILARTSSFMKIPHGYIQLFEPDGKTFTFKYGLGRFAQWIGQTVRFDSRGVFSEVLRTGRLVMVEDYQNWPLRLENEDTAGMTAVVQAPLTVDGKMIGTIGFACYGEPLQKDRDKLIMFEQFASLAATAIRNLLAHQEINRLAYYDTLTGLPNREHLKMRLNEELNRAGCGESAGAVMHLDLDDFQHINDHYGHTYGDKVIATVGQEIVSVVGAGAYVARSGGDAFVVILPGADLARITSIADDLIGAVAKEFEIQGQRILLTASIGVSLYPVDAGTGEDIVKNAEIALYAAKGAGKNNWRFYDQAMLKAVYDQMVLTNSLRRALERGELYLQYQPQFALPDRNLVGFEALLRWNSKEHGIVSPARFIPLAEQKGLIHRPIGEWVIAEACRFVRTLTDMGRTDLYVAVNISPFQLAADDFVEVLHKHVDEAAIAPQQLELEITESALIESFGPSIDKLIQLRALGVRLALDDFGTGYSSLTHLRNLPVKTLKIDRSFIKGMLDNDEEENFIHSIIDMAHVRKLHVLAEGVETEAQLVKLEQLGCDVVQGFFFSKAVDPEEALRFVPNLSPL